MRRLDKIQVVIVVLILLLGLLLGCRRELPAQLGFGLTNAVQFVEVFNTSNGRLPDRNEFHVWLGTNGAPGVADYYAESTSNSRPYYRIHLWRGERMLIYSSRTKTLDETQ